VYAFLEENRVKTGKGDWKMRNFLFETGHLGTVQPSRRFSSTSASALWNVSDASIVILV
jgi:hypothetical protein